MTDPKRVGYSRYGSLADLQLQLSILMRHGCRPILFDEGLTRAADQSRPELHHAIEACGRGDTLVVPALARLVISLSDALVVLERIHERGVTLEVDGVPYHWISSAVGRDFLDGFAEAAKLSSMLRSLTTRYGLEGARTEGRLTGGTSVLTDAQRAFAVDEKRRGRPNREIADILNVDTSTISRIRIPPNDDSHAPADQRDPDPR